VVDVLPFRALRPATGMASRVASVPYDVVNSEEAKALASDELSFLHVTRSEIDLPAGEDPYSQSVYRRAVENLKKLEKSVPLIVEESDSYYIYRLEMNGHIQTGIAACCSVDDYDRGLIKKHEKTRRDKEDDRTRHIVELRAQTGAVFLIYKPQEEINRIVDKVTSTEPLYDFTAADGVKHTIWRTTDTKPILAAFQKIDSTYIADGHHRAASASRARATLMENKSHTGEEEYNRFIAVLFPSDQVQILPYNRIVRDLNGLSESEFISAVSKNFDLTTDARPIPESPNSFRMYLKGVWYDLKLKGPKQAGSDPVARLVVSLLQENLLDPILGIKDVRTDKRIDFVGGIRGTVELERLVNEGKAAVAFSLYPTTVQDLIAVSDAGSIMPPKSTWFEPKLRDGLLVHLI
jgi:uncharacterized protein (DUF1015 family)